MSSISPSQAAVPTNSNSASGKGAALVEMPDDIESINRLYQERRWSDGLPIIPPTQARVERMLSGCARDAHEIVATIAPGVGAATVQRIAINAVMAGCQPEHMPVLLAAVQAVAAPRFNLQAIQCTTHPAAVWLIVNGPIAERLQINGSYNCLGQGTPANAVLGRALRLVLQNIGGARPGEMDRSTHGQPGKYSFCCAENEAETPWPPLHVERGFTAEASTVTVVGAGGTHSLNTHAKDADDLLRVIADAMAFSGSNDYWIAGEPWMILCPEHAEVLKNDGLDKAEVKRRLWEETRLRGRDVAKKDLARIQDARRAELGDIGPDTLLPIASTPEDIGILVAGGRGTHSVYVPSFGDTRAATVEIADPR